MAHYTYIHTLVTNPARFNIRCVGELPQGDALCGTCGSTAATALGQDQEDLCYTQAQCVLLRARMMALAGAPGVFASWFKASGAAILSQLRGVWSMGKLRLWSCE